MTTPTLTDPIITAHRFVWSKTDTINTVIILGLLEGMFSLIKYGIGSPYALMTGAFSVVIAGWASYVTFSRKKKSALEIRNHNGVWRLYKGGKTTGAAGTFITVADIENVHYRTDNGGFLTLIGKNTDTQAHESLNIPQRLLTADAGAALKQALAPTLATANVTDEARTALVDN
jgi:hypothetical protein